MIELYDADCTLTLTEAQRDWLLASGMIFSGVDGFFPCRDLDLENCQEALVFHGIASRHKLPAADTRALTPQEWKDATIVAKLYGTHEARCADASDLFLAPGAWPCVIVTPAGDRLRPVSSNEMRVIYADERRRIQLTVCND
jgi:hypothetical protein